MFIATPSAWFPIWQHDIREMIRMTIRSATRPNDAGFVRTLYHIPTIPPMDAPTPLFSFALDELVERKHRFADGEEDSWMVPTRRAFHRHRAEFEREFMLLVREAEESVTKFRNIAVRTGHPHPEIVIGPPDNAIHSWTWDDFVAEVSAFYDAMEREEQPGPKL